MAFTHSELDELQSMLAMGVLEAEFNGRKQKFDSKNGLIARMTYIRESLKIAQGETGRVRQLRINVSKGI